MNYHKKVFRVISNSENGELDPGMRFDYIQEGHILTCSYSSKHIISGHILGTVDEAGHISMTYHQLNDKGEIMTGNCLSIPEIMENGKIRLYETWNWTSGDHSSGSSILEEI